MSTKEVEVPASMEYLGDVMGMISGLLEDIGCGEDTKRYIEVSAEELFTNIASYAYQPGEGMVRVECSLVPAKDGADVILSFCDSGRPYNPFVREDPDFNLPIEERPVGGLGVYMVKEFMDKAEYCHKDGCNVTTITKYVEGGGNEALL